MTLRGWATFAWQADYGQFYLVDDAGESFDAPVRITPEMEARRVHAPATGLVVYTQDCLQQQIRVAIHAAEPTPEATEPMSGKPWTQVETIAARFPARRFTLSSPSTPSPLPAGPVFLLDTPTVRARVSWLEFEGSRDDSVPVEPDVIDIVLWPD